ncbi:alginate export family protein [Novosphingobium sp. 9]|uniref:alginate export family protein n=1 Tax=Novosphingobium sp. 9 TaxID=2025349 RepID=UPI0021B55A26|nr:alginate export family protein [Novosphingobium sp. 9]
MDSRIYFDNTKTPVTVNDVNAMELIQAYVGLDLGHVLGKGSDTSVQAGRFTMEFGARRLIARNNFRNDTNAYTGIRFDVTTADKTKITAFYTLPLTRLPSTIDQLVDNSVHWDRESFDLQFWGAYLAKPQLVGRTNLDLYFLGLNERDSPSLATKNRQLYTPGLRLFMNPEAGKPDFEVEADYQFGSVRASTAANAALLDVSAYYVHAELGYQFAGPWKPHVKLVYDRASGDNGKGSYNRFDSLFGARNPDWGPTSIYGALSRSNISSPGVRLDFAHGKRTDGNLTYRAMWLDSATDSFANTGVRDATGKSGTFAGQQVEWRVRYWIVPQFLRLETGAAWLINGRFLKDAPNASGRGNPIYGFFGVTATF